MFINKRLFNKLDKNGFLNLKGELEIFGKKNGKIIYYDVGENTVTIWAKHATMHLLTGESFTTHGEQRLFDTDDASAHTATGSGEGTNKDGTLISGEQYFSNNSSPDFDLFSRWSKATITPNTAVGDASNLTDQVKYPLFPTKILFGTGFEFRNWATLDSTYPDYRQAYEDQGWDQPTFDSNIADVKNYYSNIWSGSSLTKSRSMNDIFAGALTTPTITDQDFGIPGAIKNGMYEDSSLSRHELNGGGSGSGTIRTYSEGGNEFLLKSWAGIGYPSFIYSRRESRFFQSGAEVQLSADSYLENKITFTTVMPEQTGSNAGIFYPYNGYTLKVAGLFTDAHMLLANTVPTGAGDDHVEEINNYNKLPGGVMFAKRYIAPITKSHDISITARWTIYL